MLISLSREAFIESSAIIRNASTRIVQVISSRSVRERIVGLVVVGRRGKKGSVTVAVALCSQKIPHFSNPGAFLLAVMLLAVR